MNLTSEQSAALDFIGDLTNEITREGNYERWKDNTFKNREFFDKGNPELKGTAVYVVCAGPSLDKNVEDLKLMGTRGIILCVDAALRFVLSRGIRPDYCMMIDGSEKLMKMMEGCDTRGITLVCTPSVTPEIVRDWKGDRFFITTPYLNSDKKHNLHHLTRLVKAKKDIKAGEDLVLDDHYEIPFTGVNFVINCGGNVSTAAHHFALQGLRCQSVIFVGQDLSWKYDSHHYAGWEHDDGHAQKQSRTDGSHINSNGERVSTNLSMLQFKRWHEMMALNFPKSCVNATEGGIFGVKQDGAHDENVEFLTLKEAIAKYSPKDDDRFSDKSRCSAE